MARRSQRQGRSSVQQQFRTDGTDTDSDDIPLSQLTADRAAAPESAVAVRTSPRRAARVASRKQKSEALQHLTAQRGQRQSKIIAQLATSTPHARQHSVLRDSQPADLIDKKAMSTHRQDPDADGVPGNSSDVRALNQSSDTSLRNEDPEVTAAAGKGQKRKAQQKSSRPSKVTAPAATLPVSDHRQKRQSYAPLASVHRQKKQKFIAGAERRSVSGSDEGDENDFIASEDDAQANSQLGRHTSGRFRAQPCSIRDWSDSCSETSQDMGKGESAEAEDEERPQPGKRPRQVSNIIGYEDGWETAAVQAQGGGNGQQAKQDNLQEQLEDESDSSQQPPTGQMRRLSKGISQEVSGKATVPAAKRARIVISDDEDEHDAQPGRSRKQHASGGNSPGPSKVSHSFAEEGLDPIKEGVEGLRRRKSTKIDAGSIRERMQLNQQRLHEGGKKSRRSQAAPFVRSQMYEWHGDRMQAVSSSDSAESKYGSSCDSEDSQQSQDGNATSEHESDLGGFIVAEEPDADDRQPSDGDAGPGPSAVSALLEEAGMVSSRTDKEHFVIYVEYLVYDLVDITFAVRVRGDSRLRKHFDTAVRHVEESLAFKRDSCATSSAWMNAVPGFLDKIDTYPGLSSDLAAKESSLEDFHDEVCQACQRSFTAGHASKRLTLKGRPYKQLWQHGFRRVSDAHVRRDLPYQDTNHADEENSPSGHQELQFAVGRYCCARLQMYHALVHYKHRLRGKLKKHIKHAHNMQKIRKQGADRVKAAKGFLQRQGVIDGLFRQYAALKDLATDYATKVSSSTWRKDQGYLGTEVDRLMYQINSDSEGDEGSDIVPEDDEGSESDDALDANDGTPGMDDVKTYAEGVKAPGMGQQTADLASASHGPPAQAEQRVPCDQQQSDVGFASSSQHSAASHADRLQAVALDPPAMEQTLPYEAGPSSLPSQQTLPYHLASGTQHGTASHSQQADIVDLTDPEKTQPAAATAALSPVQGSSLGSPASPVSGSAKKHKQADIRGYLSPRATQH